MSHPEPIQFCSFPTALGFMALAWKNKSIVATVLPEKSQATAEKNLLKKMNHKIFAKEKIEKSISPTAKIKSLVKKIKKHLDGSPQDFSKLSLYTEHLPVFRKKIYSVAQKIPAGTTLSYGELAKLAKSDGAARAVGSAMANNPIPLIVPCHRILASKGKAGGFTATGGLKTKATLLSLEGCKTAW